MKLQVIKQRKFWWGISLSITLIGFIAMGISWASIGAPLRPSLDFIGGTRLQLERDCSVANACSEPLDLAQVRDVLLAQDLGNSSIQVIGEERQGISIRTKALSPDERTSLEQALTDALGQFDPTATQIDTVGPTLGRQIFTSGVLALLVSFALITGYLTIRFQLDYAMLALLALVHDVLITMSVFAVLGLALGLEVDSLFIVALLTIVGFSVNDTVVIYDRIREVLKVNPSRDINEVVDEAVNQTLTRSINTTLTTLFPLTAIFLLGGETLKYFALALIVGFVAGAYSSIFIASTTLAWWRHRQMSSSPAIATTEATTEDDIVAASFEGGDIIEASFNPEDPST